MDDKGLSYFIGIEKDMILPCADKDGQAENCSHNAIFIRKKIEKFSPVAIPLNLDNFTKFHISFLPLYIAVPVNVSYNSGMGKSGIQISIDRMGSYSLGLGNPISKEYLVEKWHVTKGDSVALEMFFNTVLTGEDYFKVYSKDVLHKLTRGKSSKKTFWDEVNEPDE